MKKYIKEGKIKHRNQIIVRKDGKQIINPTEEMLIADGWVEYIIPVYEPTLEDIKRHKKEEILYFDSSNEINEFTINEIPVWLDKATRAGLVLRFQAEVAVGNTETTLWYNGLEFRLPLDKAVQMLYVIEIYASQCYDNTQKHLAEVDKLEDVDEINNYNYRIGYPEKLKF